MVRRPLAIILVGTSVFAAACGSDDSPESSKPAAGTTSDSGATSRIPPIPEIPSGDRSGRNSRGTGSSGSSNGSSRGDGSARDRSSRRGGSRTRKEDQPGFSPPGSPGQVPPVGSDGAYEIKSDSAAYRLSREICANVTLRGVALNLRINLQHRDAAFVATAFARSFPREHRDAAARGCLDGFRNPVKR